MVGSQIVREYTYAYMAACPETGETYSQILPYVNDCCMNLFMQGVSETFAGNRIIMVMDRASWHTGSKTKRWKNIILMFQPPYSPELNPVECMWHHIREKENFKNTTFNTLDDVERKLEKCLKNLDKSTVKSITLLH